MDRAPIIIRPRTKLAMSNAYICMLMHYCCRIAIATARGPRWDYTMHVRQSDDKSRSKGFNQRRWRLVFVRPRLQSHPHLSSQTRFTSFARTCAIATQKVQSVPQYKSHTQRGSHRLRHFFACFSTPTNYIGWKGRTLVRN
jgi:hypothetical protein